MLANRSTKFLFIALIIVAALITLAFATFSSKAPSADRSFDAVELVRLSRSSHSAIAPAVGYEEVESMRLSRSAPASADAVEQIRGSRLGPSHTLTIQPSADRSFDAIETLRLQRSSK